MDSPLEDFLPSPGSHRCTLPSWLASWFPPGPSLFLCLIVGGNRSPPWLTHTHTLASKAGSDNRAGLDIEQGAWLPGHIPLCITCTYTLRWTISAYTHWTLGLLCPGDTDAGRIGAPMGIAGISTCTHWPLLASTTGTAIVLVLGVPWADSLGIPALSGSKFPAAPQP